MSSIDELVATLSSVEQQLEEAGAHLGTCRLRLEEARRALTRLDPEHPETVVPPGLPRSDDQIERVQHTIELTANTIRDFATRL
ncbi:hypothetical protein GCM10009854_12670 [Saccharopolyspora halophila]|uniref:Uncharacterized protein n=1 Tax=Saccharopolyspora halophila TaxID=405551 RepID=A0ABN3FVM9_9PSEU